jgi:quercetin dioxygenase-like cupin family protein
MPRTLRISPHQILTILRSDAEVFEVESVYEPGGAAPPPHFHPYHDETFEITDGTLHAVVDGQARDIPAGGTLDVRRGQVHAFWNVSTAPARVHWISRPAMDTDRWFTGLAQLAERAQQSGAGIDKYAFAMHAAAHRDTFRLAPGGRTYVGALATPLLAFAGRLTGHRAPG